MLVRDLLQRPNPMGLFCCFSPHPRRRLVYCRASALPTLNAPFPPSRIPRLLFVLCFLHHCFSQSRVRVQAAGPPREHCGRPDDWWQGVGVVGLPCSTSCMTTLHPKGSARMRACMWSCGCCGNSAPVLARPGSRCCRPPLQTAASCWPFCTAWCQGVPTTSPTASRWPW